ncbi:hypothetical protein U1701_13130 [Sphingomonas sp. PB2P19]|uniref:hypothetical protein n=1 Tax=Sphingomonas rhamnosi TaxID=3096156 RepID=UPI002FCC9C6A
MATPNGVVTFEVDGEAHTLRYGINELCRLEDRLQMDVTGLAAKMAAGLNMRTLRTMFACGMPGDVTDDDAGAFIDGVGLQRAGELVGEAMQAAFPSAEGKAQKPVRPAKVAAGTGSTS